MTAKHQLARLDKTLAARKDEVDALRRESYLAERELAEIRKVRARCAAEGRGHHGN